MPTLEVPPTAAQVLQLEQTRIIKATRARVYEAWIKPEVLKLWLGSATTHCPSPVVDVRVGGAYRLEFQPTPSPGDAATTSASEKPAVAATGTYTRIIPNELLEFTWIPSFQPEEESLVTITFKDAPGGTEITLRHGPFLSEGSREGHDKGWAGAVEKLAKALEA